MGLGLSTGMLGCVGTPDSADDGDEVAAVAGRDRIVREIAAIPQFAHKRVCDVPAAPGFAACHARVRTDANGVVPNLTAPSGHNPVDLKAAYNLPATGGVGVTVALIDAYDNPNAEADMMTYRQAYNLPPCSTANGCFKKVNQKGLSSPLPAKSKTWASEIMVDIDMISAVCPSCKIILVEANSPSMTDLGAGENAAAALGAKVISNSFGGPESSGIASYEPYFTHVGVAIFVSAGDGGYGAEYPASSAHVIAVGGTTLVKSSSSSRGWVEATWGSGATSATTGGTGSGCSAYISKPVWQKDTGCAKRTVADMAAVADPNTGVAVYDSYGIGGWGVFGGTSVAAPVAAAAFARTGRASMGASFIYANVGSFYDVTTGSDGSCSSSYLCTAGAGYDGPTGVGTPNGLALTAASASTGPIGATGSTGSASPPDAGVGGCAHSMCTVGTKLQSSCDTCAAAICAEDSACCGTSWDSQCVSQVQSICGESLCTGGIGGPTGSTGSTGSTNTCAHSICSAGVDLPASCDPCAAEVCTRDSFCCAHTWDSICVSEVGSICKESCL